MQVLQAILVSVINNNALIQWGSVSLSQQWVDWSMPTLTSNTSTVSEGTITCSNNTSKTNAYVVWSYISFT